jgi:heterodisulfide reductase subunit A-like polyferredoxin
MEANIGVFICDCGKSMNNIDFSGVREKVAKIPHVTCVNLSSNLCLEEGKKQMTSCIRDKNIDRVVVAACSPECREHVFQQVLEKAGLNRHLFCMANIREQCSWAHEGDVTEKALELIRMAVNRTRPLQAVEEKELSVNKGVLVVGGGFSALSSTIQLSQLGLPTTLLERESTLGGRIRELEYLYGLEINPMIRTIEKDGNIEILTSAEVIEVEGKMGNFMVRIRKGAEGISRSFGAIVFATGYETEVADQDFQLKPGVNIISQERLAQMLQASSPKERPQTVGFIFDFYGDNSRFPTLASLSNALAIKQKWGSEVYVLCRDVKVDSEGADQLYREARERGVVFLKFEEKPRISADDGRVKVEVKDVFLGEDMALICDLVVAEERILPPAGTKDLSSLLSIKTDSQGFYQDENVHLYPVSSERKGIFFIGGCRGDLDFRRALADVSSVVMNVHRLLSSGKVVVESEKVKVDPQKCVACLTCIRVCPHSAIQLARTEGEKEVAEISDLACDACGVCAAICPAKAIKFEGYSDEQILAQIEALGAS